MLSRLRNNRGSFLAVIVGLLLMLVILVPAVIRWAGQETKMSVKEQKSTMAFNLAETAVNRGLYKLKSTTSTWKQATQGTLLAGYDFDATYSDVPGGTYRIRFASGPAANEVTIFGEGRDAGLKETRAIKAVYANSSFPGSIIAAGVVNYDGAFEAHWGPIFSQNNIVLSGNAAMEYFPRKLSKQVVLGTGGQPRDTNGINPPNTDNTEWWSDYAVPEVPKLDFATMRSSAAANGTLNYYTTSGAPGPGKCIGWPGHDRCRSGTNSWASHAGLPHFFDSFHNSSAPMNLIWYWDGDLVLSGSQAGGCHGIGIRGHVIVRGNLTIDNEDCYAYAARVPPLAWKEYKQIKSTQFDTAAANEYPADNGYQSVRPTFGLGTEGWTGFGSADKGDVGVRGLVYVGGNLTINNATECDVHGAMWVVGNVTNNNTGNRTLIFYDDTIELPTLNVVLMPSSWEETRPNPAPWP